MKEQFVHTLTNSFMLWFDHFLLEKGEAFSNQTGTFYHTPDNFLDDSYVPFSSPYKQFVTDSSITGATLPTGIAGDSHYIDYEFFPYLRLPNHQILLIIYLNLCQHRIFQLP